MNTMWCKHCRQDVPAQTAAAQQRLCCPRCGGDVDYDRLNRGAAEAVTGDQDKKVSVSASGPANAPPSYDGWEMDEQLRHIERMLRPAEVARRQTRIDLGHAGRPTWHTPVAHSAGTRRKPAGRAPGYASAVFTWTILALGTISSLGGGILLACSVVANRQQLWTIGLPLTLMGQIVLLVGLELQTNRLWRHSRRSAAKLDSVHEQLRELKTSATLLATAPDPAGSAFYSHFAGGASAELLLADLKSRLDLLAMKIAEQER
jgi:hypothetical protein